MKSSSTSPLILNDLGETAVGVIENVLEFGLVPDPETKLSLDLFYPFPIPPPISVPSTLLLFPLILKSSNASLYCYYFGRSES